MTGRSGQIEARSLAPFARAMFAACVTLLVASALAQESRPPADIPSQKEGEGAANLAPPWMPDLQRRPGLVDAIGGWLGDSTTRFRLDLQDAQQTFDQLTDQTREAAKEVAKDATGAMIGVPNMRIVTVRERCPRAASGGPDCQTAAAMACRGKGFAGGKSLDTQSEQKCPAQVLLRGRTPNELECRTETFVTRALCQ
ncbi:MAG TPA: hypothetical protein VE667_02535 [Xanthobacteraceae bacterium]|nr:hypothetical protein [Xanthobacteraceae bacterium]